MADDLRHVDVLVAPDHKFLLNAGRGMGYCYLSPAAQARFTPVSAGWRAGSVPFDSFFGPAMNLSATASRFDSSISWLAAIGNQAALAVFDDFGPGTIYARNHELTAKLRAALTGIGWDPVDLPEQNQSTIVSVPLGDSAAAAAAQRTVRAGSHLLGAGRQPAACGPLLQPRRRHRATRHHPRLRPLGATDSGPFVTGGFGRAGEEQPLPGVGEVVAELLG